MADAGSGQGGPGEALSAYFVGDVSLQEALVKVCDAALDAMRPAFMVGVSMTVDARVGTYVFSHPEAQAVDQAQYDSGDGPCLEAFRTGQPVLVQPIDTDATSYRRFRRLAAAHGVSSVMAIPMDARGQIVGALNFYSHADLAFGDEWVDVGRSFATQAAYLLLNHQAYWDAHSLGENLQQALVSRAEIEQAKGIIMATTGCGADEAFTKLREQSQTENVKLRDIAAQIVRRTARGRSTPS